MTRPRKTTNEMPSPFGISFDAFNISSLFTQNGHAGLLDTRLHALGDDWVELALPWSESIVIDAESGVLASGPVISLLDNATGIAVWQRLGMITYQATVDLRLDYLREPTPRKQLIARGECYGMAGALAYVRGIAYEDSPDDPVAVATGTYMQVEQA